MKFFNHRRATPRIFFTFLLVLVFCTGHSPSYAEFQRTKIAVLDFEQIGDKHETSGMGAIVSEWFITGIVKNGRFDVVERAMLQKIVSEQKLSSSGIIDETSAAALGKILGVKVIISGSIVKLRDTIEINSRVINVEDGSIIAAESSRGNAKDELHGLVDDLLVKILSNFPLTGYVVKRNPKSVIIDLGLSSGLSPGTEFLIYKEGQVIKHPKTGEILDVEQIITGRLVITKVSQSIAEGEIKSEEADGIQYGQLVKSVQKETHKTPAKKQEKPVEKIIVKESPVKQEAVVAADSIKQLDKPIEKQAAKDIPTPQKHPVVAKTASLQQEQVREKEQAQEKSKIQRQVSAAQPVTPPPPPIVKAQSPPPANVVKEQPKVAVIPEQTSSEEKPSVNNQKPQAESGSVGVQPAKQAGPRNHVAVFPSTFQVQADAIKGYVDGGIPGDVEEVLKELDASKKFTFTNRHKDEGLKKISWNDNKPNMNEIIDLAKQQKIDFVVLYSFSFWRGQGLTNGWGQDFRNPNFKVFLVDVLNQTVLEKEDTRTIALDQLLIELKSMTRQLLRKTTFPN